MDNFGVQPSPSGSKRKWIILLCGILGLILLISFIVEQVRDFKFFSQVTRYENYIFADISECERLIPPEGSNATFERYEAPTEDPNWKGFPYKSFFGGIYRSDSLEFKIFAYVFEAEESTQHYFKKAKSTKVPKGITRNIRGDKNKVFSIYASENDMDEVQKMLSEVFTINLSARPLSTTTAQTSN